MAQFTASIKINAVENLGKVAKSISKSTAKMRKGFEKLGKTMKKIGAGMGKLTRRMSLMGVVAAAAFLLAIKRTADFGDNLDKTNIKTGIAVEKLQRLRLAAQLGGGSFRDLDTGLKVFARVIDEASQGTDEYADLFRRLKIPMKDVNGVLRDQEDIFDDVADRFSLMTNATQKGAIAQQMFGRGGMNLIPMLEGGSKKITELGKRLKIVFTKEDAKKSAAFNDEMLIMSTNLRMVLRKALLPVLPKLTELFTKIDENTDNIHKWVGENVDLAAFIEKIQEVAKTTDFSELFDVSVDNIKAVVEEIRTIIHETAAFIEWARDFDLLDPFRKSTILEKMGTAPKQRTIGDTLFAPYKGGKDSMKLDITIHDTGDGRRMITMPNAPSGVSFKSDGVIMIPQEAF